MNLVEGSAEHTLLVEKQKANWEETANKFTMGEGNLQLLAKAKLEEMGYENVNVMEAMSMLATEKVTKGEHQF